MAHRSNISDDRAMRILVGLRDGKTPRLLWTTPDHLKSYCAAHPEFAREALPLIEANAKAARGRKGAYLRDRTKDMCLKGLHPMTGANVRIDPSRGRRACLACRYIARDSPPLIKPDVLAKIRKAFEAGASYRQICTGRPVGGGKIDQSLRLTTPKKFYQQRRIDPEFDKLAATYLADSYSTGQKKRWHRIITHIRTNTARSEANDYHKIRDMIPESNPHRGDIIARIFEDMLSGALQREDVRSRVSTYIAEFNNLYPTKYRKFGDSLLVSLDEGLFDDGTATRGDTVSRGLWD